MAVLITGTGLIGSHVAQRLVHQGARPVLFDVAPSAEYVGRIAGTGNVELVRGDLLSLPELLEVFAAHRIEAVVHTAAAVGPQMEQRPYGGWRVNVDGTLNVLDAARLSGVRRVVFCSSQSVYDFSLPSSGPMTEDHPVKGDTMYTASKLAGENLGLNYARIYGLEFIVLRFTSVFGPRFGHGESRIGRLWNDLVEGVALGRPVRLEVPAFFAASNDFVYVKDVAKALTLAATVAAPEHRLFNIGSGQLRGAQDLLRAMRELAPAAGIQMSVAPGGVSPGPERQPYNLARAREELGYRPDYDLTAALADQLRTVQAALAPGPEAVAGEGA